MEAKEKLLEATKKIRRTAETVADLDKTRPRFHFHSPAQWGDDPSGFIFYKGYYHMMYGSNPDSYTVGSGMPYRTPNNRWSPDEPEYFDGVALWGHARSKDMVHWEHMPSVCYPDVENDEYFIWWGCTRINGDGIPVIIYTSLGRTRGPYDGAQQRMLIGSDDNLVHWNHYKNNPIMSNAIHGNQFIYQWRDPFTFDNDGKTYMVLGGKLSEEKGGDCVVLLYEACNSAFTQWTYKGIFFRYPEKSRKSVECPLVAKLGGRWALIISPHGPVEYFIGDIDFEQSQFNATERGYVDRGTAFYAPNITFDSRGRCVMFAAVEGFENTKGWNGVMCVPRELTIDNGKLKQRVPKEFNILRKSMYDLSKQRIVVCDEAVFEIEAVLNKAEKLFLKIRYDDQILDISYSEGIFTICGKKIKTMSMQNNARLKLYFDISVVDALMDDAESFVKVIPPCEGKCQIEAWSTDSLSKINVWQYDASNLFKYFESDKN